MKSLLSGNHGSWRPIVYPCALNCFWDCREQILARRVWQKCLRDEDLMVYFFAFTGKPFSVALKCNTCPSCPAHPWGSFPTGYVFWKVILQSLRAHRLGKCCRGIRSRESVDSWQYICGAVWWYRLFMLKLWSSSSTMRESSSTPNIHNAHRGRDHYISRWQPTVRP